MSQSPSLAIIVLYFNTPEVTSKVIQSILGSTYENKHLIVVDNNSRVYPVSNVLLNCQVNHLVSLPENVGFSAGINAGIKFAIKNLEADYIAIVNSDLCLEPHCLQNGIDDLEILRRYLPIGALTGKIMFDDDRSHLIWQAGGHIDPLRVSGVSYGYMQEDGPEYSFGCLTGWASGAFSIFPVSTFNQLGLFSEQYFFGQEEWDYSSRLLSNNSLIYYSPRCLSWHRVGASYKCQHPVLNTYNGYCNKVIYARKWVSAFPLWYIVFALRTVIFLPKILKANCFDCSDVMPQLKAILLSLIISPFKSKITAHHLEKVAKLIGSSNSWPFLWTANPLS